MSEAAPARKPRVLFVSPTRYRLPLRPSLRRRFEALGAAFELRVLARAADGSRGGEGAFRLVPAVRPRALDGVAFYLALPLRVARELRRFRPDAVIVQGAHETAAALLARSLARVETKVVLDLHGDWRTATRLYGSPLRRLLNPLADRLSALAVRRADAVRTISDFTTALVRRLGVEPAAVFPAYVDLAAFRARPPAPLPESPRAVFVGVLERYKNVDGVAAAWRAAAPRVPGAVLQLVGRGARTDLVEGLVADLPQQTVWTPELSREEVAEALDRATVLLLPSRSEGLPRVVMEAFCRGRGVIGGRSGGTRDMIEHGVNGLLVEPEDVEDIAAALTSVLSDGALAERLAAGARTSADRWLATPEEFAARMRSLVARVTGLH